MTIRTSNDSEEVTSLYFTCASSIAFHEIIYNLIKFCYEEWLFLLECLLRIFIVLKCTYFKCTCFKWVYIYV